MNKIVNYKKTFCVMLFAAWVAAPAAYAGQLFPPANLASAASSCPSGSFLFWTGSSVTCQAMNVSCPTGQYMTGIANGAATCQAMAATSPTTVASSTPAAVSAPASTPDTTAVSNAATPDTTSTPSGGATTMYSYIGQSGILTNTTQPCSSCGTLTSQAPIDTSTAAGAAQAEADYGANYSILGATGGEVYSNNAPPSCYGAACGYQAAAEANGIDPSAAAGVAATVIAYENLGLSEADAMAKTNDYYGGTVVSAPASQ